jgi:hypothetical protein
MATLRLTRGQTVIQRNRALGRGEEKTPGRQRGVLLPDVLQYLLLPGHG